MHTDMIRRITPPDAAPECCLPPLPPPQVGVHTDMIKRANEKLSPQRLEQLHELALRPETVAMMAGLDFARDVGIRWGGAPCVTWGSM